MTDTDTDEQRPPTDAASLLALLVQHRWYPVVWGDSPYSRRTVWTWACTCGAPGQGTESKVRHASADRAAAAAVMHLGEAILPMGHVILGDDDKEAVITALRDRMTRVPFDEAADIEALAGWIEDQG